MIIRPKVGSSPISLRRGSSGRLGGRGYPVITGVHVVPTYTYTGYNLPAQGGGGVCRVPSNESGPDLVNRQDQYITCPIHMHYCCSSDLYLGERCCTGSAYYAHSSSLGTIIGYIVGVLVMILCIGLILYYCCLESSSESSIGDSTIDSDESTSIGTDITVGGYDSAFDPQVPPPPVPSGPNPTYYPVSNHLMLLP
nr:expressed protein [Hymenolepis microstoma]CDS35382.1 expressed protein [Hymenolepis microstoma]